MRIICLILLSLALTYTDCQITILNEYNCESANTKGCATCFGNMSIEPTLMSCTNILNQKCLQLVSGSITKCELCQATWRLDTVTYGCLSYSCTTVGALWCSYDSTTNNETPLICNTGYYYQSSSSSCVTTDITNKIDNCQYHYANTSLSGNVDSKCYKCNFGYVLNNDELSCVSTTDSLQTACRKFGASSTTACAACNYGTAQVMIDNSWCSGFLLIFMLTNVFVYAFAL